ESCMVLVSVSPKSPVACGSAALRSGGFWDDPYFSEKYAITHRFVQTEGMSGAQPHGPTIDELLRTAIEQRRLIRFRYRDQERIVEPHDYGIHKGSRKLLGYQGGRLQSRATSELAMVGDRIDCRSESAGSHFSRCRPTPSSQHHKWGQLFI